jgi:hypothetical protein
VTTKSPRRQRSQRCDAAAGKGTPSKGERRDARKPPGGDRQGARPAMDGLSGLAPPKGEQKRIEPQDRLQDATSLRIWWRSKPARSCETTRSERVEVQAPRSRRGSNTAGKATRNQMMSMEGCGRKPDESHERRSAPTDQGRSNERIESSSRSNEERSSRGAVLRERPQGRQRRTRHRGKPRGSSRATGKDERGATKAERVATAGKAGPRRYLHRMSPHHAP